MPLGSCDKTFVDAPWEVVRTLNGCHLKLLMMHAHISRLEAFKKKKQKIGRLRLPIVHAYFLTWLIVTLNGTDTFFLLIQVTMSAVKSLMA